MAQNTEYIFTAPLSHIEDMLVHTVVYIPGKILSKLPPRRVRVKGTINDVPFSLAVQYRKSGQSFFMVSAPLRRAAKIKAGDKVRVSFHMVDAEKVDLPEELEAVLEQDPEGRKAWQCFTPGLQRSLAHYVFSVKNIDSRIKRAIFLVNKAKTGAYDKEQRKKNN